MDFRAVIHLATMTDLISQRIIYGKFVKRLGVRQSNVHQIVYSWIDSHEAFICNSMVFNVARHFFPIETCTLGDAEIHLIIQIRKGVKAIDTRRQQSFELSDADQRWGYIVPVKMTTQSQIQQFARFQTDETIFFPFAPNRLNSFPIEHR